MRFGTTLLLVCLAGAPAHAAALQVEPVLVDVAVPGLSSMLTLKNAGNTPVTAQIRVYRWSQSNGQEKLEPTAEVAASPPAATLPPGGMQTVRIVRVRKDAVAGEESYRLFIDQLPQPAQARTGLVSLVVRHSIPAFFRSAEPGSPAVSWSTEVAKGKVSVTARNDGPRRLRIASLQLRDAKGATVKFGDGLVGYVLGKSSMRWTAPLGSHGLVGGQLSVSAQSDMGPVNAVAGRKVAP